MVLKHLNVKKNAHFHNKRNHMSNQNLLQNLFQPTVPSNRSQPVTTSQYDNLQTDQISPIVSMYSNFSLDHYIRPAELKTCQTRAPHLPLAECACLMAGVSDKPDSSGMVFDPTYTVPQLMSACQDGFAKGQTQQNRNQLDGFKWCLSQYPGQYDNSLQDGYVNPAQAWLTGCMTGLTSQTSSAKK